MTVQIQSMTAQDWPAVRAIYEEGIATGHATFETRPPQWQEWDQNHLSGCRIVAQRDRQIVGWGALSPISGRRVYAGVAEVSVYVAAGARGQGIGTAILQTLVTESEQAGIWTLQAGIFPENRASIALHRACGFGVVGRRQGLGQMAGIWRDVLLMERRSKVVGV